MLDIVLIARGPKRNRAKLLFNDLVSSGAELDRMVKAGIHPQRAAWDLNNEDDATLKNNYFINYKEDAATKRLGREFLQAEGKMTSETLRQEGV